MENRFIYKISIIVPVFNGEKRITECVSSLISQDMPNSEYEIILVDDGSSDNTLKMCREFALGFRNVRVIENKHKGVSHARNTGILNAKGKYIMFLDSDDTLASDTLSAVANFFDKHYYEVDMVTYPERKYVGNEIQPLHFRYNYLKETGIYDLNKYIYITQSRINVAVKNNENPVLFDEELGYAEDQDYLFNILKHKMKIGFVNQGEYRYNLLNNSVVGGYGYAYYMFESVFANYYEKRLIQADNVPEYIQALCLYDFNWKIRLDQLFPYHYNEEKFNEALVRIKNVLAKIDNKIILEHPALDYYHRFYLLKLKGEDITPVTLNNSLCLCAGGNVIASQNFQSIIVEKFLVRDKKLSMIGAIKSVMLDFCEKPELYACVDNRRIKLELFKSNTSRYKSKIETNLFWGFYFDIELENVSNISFEISIDNIFFPVSYYFMPFTPFSLNQKEGTYISGNACIEFNGSSFSVTTIYKGPTYKHYRKQIEAISQVKPEFAEIRQMALEKEQENRKIWLYYDCITVEKDNGYYQFMHDIKKKDDIDRYYIIHRSEEDAAALFDENLLQNNVVFFGTPEHMALLLCADKVISAYAEKDNIYPVHVPDIVYFSDLFRFEVVYLQHGILHASIPWKYNPESLRIDKVVVSSEFEENNFISNYNFRECDIIKSGMPRFMHMNKKAESVNRILLAPSWRNYLITPQVDGYWEPQTDKFINSDYFIKLDAFLNSEELQNSLESHNYHLDLKLHPIFAAYKDCFNLKNKNVHLYDGSTPDDNYAMFITDFSSYLFNFAYRCKCMAFFVPDYEQFLSGMNQYRRLDLPFEKSFGPLFTDSAELMKYIADALERNCQPDDLYKKRMNEFFLPFKDCEEDIYKAIID